MSEWTAPYILVGEPGRFPWRLLDAADRLIRQDNEAQCRAALKELVDLARKRETPRP